MPLPGFHVHDGESAANALHPHVEPNELTDAAAVYLGYSAQVQNQERSATARHQFREVGEPLNVGLDDEATREAEHNRRSPPAKADTQSLSMLEILHNPS